MHIICLGNVGDEYKYTWHNVAWLLADYIVPADLWTFDKYAKAFVAKYEGNLWYKPTTFMNKSGEVLEYITVKNNIETKDLLVIHDDIDIDFGEIKLSFSKGDGGHNGVKSIKKAWGNEGFGRIRIGIMSDLFSNFASRKEYVLSNMTLDQKEKLPSISNKLQSIILLLDNSSFELAMNQFN